jgi:outer membrane protein assembly factor BamA
MTSAVASLVGRDYSRHFVAGYAVATLVPLYRHYGYWRAAFREPVPVLGGAQGCQGLTVTLTADESSPFSWDRAEWNKATLMSAAELDAILGMKSGNVADGSKIRTGLEAVHMAYGRRGYVLEKDTSTPVLDDATRHAMFQIAIDEGPQFHMGTITIEGVPARDSEVVTGRWRLKAGDIYDAEYLSEFRRKELAVRIGPGKMAVPQLTVDQLKHVIDVKIVVKDRGGQS